MPNDPVDLSLSQLRCLLVVVKAGGFAEAARRLGLSTSAVSKTIARLEATHGVRLLHRSTHSVSPTEECRALLAPAGAAAQAMDELVQALDHAATRTGGSVRLTAPIAFQRHCLIPLLPALRRDHPDLHLDLRASNDFLDLADHGIDLAIRSGELDAVPGHVRQPWFSCPWIVCAAPNYLASHAMPTVPADLSAHDLIGFRASDDGLVRAWRFRDPLTRTVLRHVPEPVLVVDDGEAGWGAALDGVGVVRAPLFLAAAAVRAGRMVELLRDWRDDDAPVSIVRRDTRLTPPRVVQMIAFLRRHPPDLTTGE